MVCAGLVLACLLVWSCQDDVYARGYTTRYDIDIQSAVSKWWPGIDWHWWKAQLIQESRLDPNAVSAVGARGLAQFMPGTWADITRQLKLGNVSPHIARHSINAGAYYMSKLAKSWHSKRPLIDRWDLARASYNAGIGNILNAQRMTNGAILYEDIIKGLPAVTGNHSVETINYVKRIHVLYREMMIR